MRVIDDSLAVSPVCEFCQHYSRDRWKTCPAFPDGIPGEIWRGDNPHKKPHPDQVGGLVFSDSSSIPTTQ